MYSCNLGSECTRTLTCKGLHMKSTPRTGNGYSESEATKDDIELDMRLKAFQSDFVKEVPRTSAKDVIRKAFRKGKS